MWNGAQLAAESIMVHVQFFLSLRRRRLHKITQEEPSYEKFSFWTPIITWDKKGWYTFSLMTSINKEFARQYVLADVLPHNTVTVTNIEEDPVHYKH